MAKGLRGDDESVKIARKCLAEYVAANYLADNTRIRSVGSSDWKVLSRSLRSALSAEERLAWAGKLCTAFIDPQVLGELKARDMNNLTRAISDLDRGQAARLVSEWFKNHKDWAKSPIGELVSTGLLVAKNDQADRKQIVTMLEEVWLARSGELSWRQCVSVGYAWFFSMPDESKARQWMIRGYESAVGTEQARAAIGAGGIGTLGQALYNVGLTGKGKGHSAFAAALAGLARRGKLVACKWWCYKGYAAPLGTPQTRLTLRAELIDAEGNPRLVVATILTLAYRNVGELKDWRQFLDVKIAASAAGDTKARWLLARAYAATIVPLKAEPQPIRANKWLERVLEVAKSASLRITAIEQLALGYAIAHEYTKGAKFLDSAAKKFTDAQTAAVIQSLRAEHVRSEVEYLKEQIGLAQTFAKKMDTLAAQSQEEKDRKFYLKWGEYDRRREKELLERLEQIRQ